jgi:hypothetical protein
MNPWEVITLMISIASRIKFRIPSSWNKSWRFRRARRRFCLSSCSTKWNVIYMLRHTYICAYLTPCCFRVLLISKIRSRTSKLQPLLSRGEPFLLLQREKNWIDREEEKVITHVFFRLSKIVDKILKAHHHLTKIYRLEKLLRLSINLKSPQASENF